MYNVYNKNNIFINIYKSKRTIKFNSQKSIKIKFD